MEIRDPRAGAIYPATRQPPNWGLIIAFLSCLYFWGAVVFGIVEVF
jgi:hypothetical protein